MSEDETIESMIARISKLEDEIAIMEREGGFASTSKVLVGYTFAEKTYPTVAASVYAVHVGIPEGVEAEGEGFGVTIPPTPAVVHVGNVGIGVPPNGSKHLIYTIGPRFVMIYNG